MKENSIELVQKPIIKHQLEKIGAFVKKRIDDLDIDNMVATEDTLKSIKKLLAELNKEFTTWEDGRKGIKKQVLSPYDEFETEYKIQIPGNYSPAIDKLKSKRDFVELKLKQIKKDGVVAYFNELCEASEIDFLKFENTGIEINLSTSVKAYQTKCNEFVKKVHDDIVLINSDEYAAEMMVEYKKTLNSSKAITDVRERKQKEKEEKARLKTIETNKRIDKLTRILFVYHDMTKTYNHVKDENVMISLSDVESLENDEFLKVFSELELKAKSLVDPEPNEPAPPIKAPEPIKTPVVESKPEEKTYKATFEVTGTMTQLKALKKYLIDNNLTYKNI